MKTKKTGIVIYITLIVIILGAGIWIYWSNSRKTKNIVVEPTTYTWESSVNKFYDSAKQVEPDKNTKSLVDELTPIIKDTVKNDVKLSESTGNKLVFVLKTIVVEGDVENIKKALENRGYKDVTVTDQHKNLTAKKDDKAITFTFSVDTTDQGKIEVML